MPFKLRSQLSKPHQSSGDSQKVWSTPTPCLPSPAPPPLSFPSFLPLTSLCPPLLSSLACTLAHRARHKAVATHTVSRPLLSLSLGLCLMWWQTAASIPLPSNFWFHILTQSCNPSPPSKVYRQGGARGSIAGQREKAHRPPTSHCPLNLFAYPPAADRSRYRGSHRLPPPAPHPQSMQQRRCSALLDPTCLLPPT
jgi:hypothetical protein